MKDNNRSRRRTIAAQNESDTRQAISMLLSFVKSKWYISSVLINFTVWRVVRLFGTQLINDTSWIFKIFYQICNTNLLFKSIYAIIIYTLLDYFFSIGCHQRPIPRIKDIPGYPIFGNLFSLGPSQSLTYLEWANKYNSPVFQMRLGNKRVVVANSYDSAKYLWMDNMSANCSRPFSYTFHKVVSSSQGLTIGTTPWNETYQNKRKATNPVLNKPAIRSYMSIIDKEATYCIRSLVNGISTDEDVEVHSYFNTYALNTSLTLNYGIRLDDVDSEMLTEIMSVEKEIGRFRGNFHNYADYIPILRLLPLRSNKLAISCRNRRDRYMDILLNTLRKNIENGTCRSCITGNILRDSSTNVSEQELKSICLTMVSAGLDTVPAMLIYFIGHMSQDYGQIIQKKAFEILEEAYPEGQAWSKCLQEDNIPYIKALVKETLRFSAMPISLPRETINDIPYKNTIIPSKTTLFLNAFAANFDPLHYNNPNKFYPERFLTPSTGPAHFAFGAGTRMCAGANLAERELYTAFVRIISSFYILSPTNPKDAMESDPRKLVKEHNSLMIEPPYFKVRLVPRNAEKLKEYLKDV